MVVRTGSARHDSSAYDLVVLSPGIDPDSPLAQNFSSRKIETIGELELGWRSCSVPVIAITGTNGKTTTTELHRANAERVRPAHHRLRKHRQAAVGIVRRQENDLDVLTVEVSSFQLETIRDVSARDQCLAEFCARSSRSLRVGRANIARRSCASSITRRRMMSRSSTRSNSCRRSRRDRSRSAPTMNEADFRLEDGCDCLSQRTGPAPGGHQADADRTTSRT